MKSKKCKRCKRDDVPQAYIKSHPAECARDAPYIINGYCSSLCQAFALRDFMLFSDIFNPVTGEVIIGELSIAKI